MKVAYFSPLSPQKSGISDYSEELLTELSKHIEIDLYVDSFKPTNEFIKNNFDIYNIIDIYENYEKYDYVMYHMGNNSIYHGNIYNTLLDIPGIVVIHDYSIHHLIAERTVGKNDWKSYIEEMKYNYAEEGEKFAIESKDGKRKVMWETANTLKYPANKRLLDNTKAVLVHSRYIMKLVKKIRPDLAVRYAPLTTPDIEIISKNEIEQLRLKYDLDNDKIILASFGYASSAKRIDKIIEALKRLKNEGYSNFLYLIVGDEVQGFDINELIKRNHMEKIVINVGFVKLGEFKDYIKLSDLCLNLRYPTQGETSASLIRILGMGKPALITDIGTFSEYPDSCTIKIRHDENEEEDIYNALKQLLNDENQLRQMGKNAYEYVKNNHTLPKAVEQYHKLLKDIDSGKIYKDNVDTYVNIINDIGDKLYELGIEENNTNTLEFISDKISELI